MASILLFFFFFFLPLEGSEENRSLPEGLRMRLKVALIFFFNATTPVFSSWERRYEEGFSGRLKPFRGLGRKIGPGLFLHYFFISQWLVIFFF